MAKVIYYIVMCDTLYGVAALAIFAICFIIIAFIAYKLLKELLLCVYKITCKLCNTSKTYKKVHTKIGVKTFS